MPEEMSPEIKNRSTSGPKIGHVYVVSMKIIEKQEGNSNLDCLPRTAVVPMSDGGQSVHARKGWG